MRCRFCNTEVHQSFVDLGLSPLCQTHIAPDELARPEVFYPLHPLVCHECWLVQLDAFVAPSAIFTDYAYFSSYSDSWLEHARRYVNGVISRFGLGRNSRVVEIASNDGYLLQFFLPHGVSVLGVEPAANVAAAARKRGIDTDVSFFGATTASRLLQERGAADLIVGNNVLAHVPDINDFVSGLRILLSAEGVVTMEFPHLLQLIRLNQFDTIYHEHFSYLSFTTASRIFQHHGLRMFDVEELPTHGGSLRIYACRQDSTGHSATPNVARLLEDEGRFGLTDAQTYSRFAARVHQTKHRLLEFLIQAKRAGRKVIGYGAPGKGNTLLNYCGIRTDFMDFTVDRNPLKQGKYTPGTRIPILDPAAIAQARPDYILLLPWNLREELQAQLAYTREWGARLLVPIPEVQVL
jgi:hypothetical protein